MLVLGPLPSPQAPALLPLPGGPGKLHPTQVATRIAAWSSTTAPLKQCPGKYCALQQFSELSRAFGSGQAAGPAWLATSQQPSAAFDFSPNWDCFCKEHQRPQDWSSIQMAAAQWRDCPSPITPPSAHQPLQRQPAEMDMVPWVHWGGSGDAAVAWASRICVANSGTTLALPYVTLTA